MADHTYFEPVSGDAVKNIDQGDGTYAHRVAAVPVSGSPLVAKGQEDVIDATLVLDTSAYADGDVLSVVAELTGFFAAASGSRLLESLVVIDEDDQGVGFDLLFLNATATLGTINTAPSISDADARKIIGRVNVLASDYIDLGGVRVAVLSSINQVLKAASGATSVWIATITRSGAPTYTASGIRLKIGVL